MSRESKRTTDAPQQASSSSATTRTTDPSSKSNLATRIVSSSLGSLIASLALMPLDVAKVRLQANNSAASLIMTPRHGKAATALAAATTATASGTSSFYNNHHNVGTFGMIRRIIATEGVVGAYAGIKPTLAMTVPTIALYFTAYEEIFWLLRSHYEYNHDDPSNRSWIPLVAGGSARLVASSITAPLEYLRTRLAASATTNGSTYARNAVTAAATTTTTTRRTTRTSLIREFQTIVQTEGVGALYRGLRSTLWRDVPFASIYWFVMENTKQQVGLDTTTMTPVEQAGFALANGAASSLVATAFTTPFDVIKTRQQALAHLQHDRRAVNNNNNKYYSYNNKPKRAAAAAARSSSSSSSFVNRKGRDVYEFCCRSAGTFEYMGQIVKTEGVAGLWRGNQARMLKVVPAYAIIVSTYEFGKSVLP